MLLVQDLNIVTDVLPIFNFTHTGQAETALLHLFRQAPGSVMAILERQEILKGFRQNWEVLSEFSYSPIYQRETQTFLNNLKSGRTSLKSSPIIARLGYLWSDEHRHRTQASLIQMVLLLDRFHERYFRRLKPADFPESFAAQLDSAKQFLESFDLSSYAVSIREKTFSITQTVQLTRTLESISSVKITAFWEFLFLFEAYWSLTKAGLKHAFCTPTFHVSTFEVKGLYHPAVVNAVPNDFQRPPDENVFLLTGPNMAGKSTLLKALGLCVYLAHLGFDVPATTCVLPCFDTIAVSINLNDDLRSGYSHFMTELLHLKTVLEQASGDQKCFAVFDELFRGTNPDDALDITRATITGLARFPHSIFFISTHLSQLEPYAANDAQAAVGSYHIDCVLTDGKPVFSYQLKRGWSRLKIGRILFDEAGLPGLLAQ
ncbi:MutS-related protein [Hymenobacter glacialis]|uniref:DNA mismatch repair proteins mutS family domain-containing protein n=1 Tax=Hymenobacter glacialis TaxID=1908236 RepID=A0A1G1T3J1_9BACT|nr:hypothetical protein [Hymenobacter glacialis]OGX85431.1 hypothetical protein BEN48_14330 [Hymenobacter glacialis]